MMVKRFNMFNKERVYCLEKTVQKYLQQVVLLKSQALKT